jgi:hypothetical protein
MKELLVSACMLLGTHAASAGTLGGSIGLAYGAFAASNPTDAYYAANITHAFNRYVLDGSVGRVTESGFGWQVDGLYEGASGSGKPEYNFYGATVHGNYQLGAFRLGGFAGGGATDNLYLRYKSTNFWYGGEVEANFGNFAIAAQIGSGSASFGDVSLDYSGKPIYQIEGRYFIGNNIMLAARYGVANARLRSDDLSVTQYGADAIIRLGQSNFYATLGYEHNYTNGDLNNNFRGNGADQTYKIGISMQFGGNLRENTRVRNPMLSPAGLALLAPLNGGVWSD